MFGVCGSSAVKIKKTLRNQTVTETQEALFSLELTHPDAKGTQWIRNGVELQNSDKYEIRCEGAVHTLRVKDCSMQDETVYSFKLGKLSANARLNVESQSLFTLLTTSKLHERLSPSCLKCQYSLFRTFSRTLHSDQDREED